MSKITVSWISAGVSSFMASYIIRHEIDAAFYIDIEDQHEDSKRFIEDSLYIADIIMTEGSVKQRWTPAPNEIYTTDVKIDRNGIHITNTESETSTIINNVEFAVLYKEKKVITVNKDTTILKKTVVEDEMTIGKLKIVPVTGGVDEVLLD